MKDNFFSVVTDIFAENLTAKNNRTVFLNTAKSNCIVLFAKISFSVTPGLPWTLRQAARMHEKHFPFKCISFCAVYGNFFVLFVQFVSPCEILIGECLKRLLVKDR